MESQLSQVRARLGRLTGWIKVVVGATSYRGSEPTSNLKGVLFVTPDGKAGGAIIQIGVL